MRLYRRGAAWWCDFWHQGRRVRRSTGTADKAEAQEYVDRLKGELWRHGRLGERPAVTWDAAVLDWLESHRHLKALSDRKDQLRWASKHLAGVRLDAIDRAQLEKLARLKSKEGVADSTVNRYLAAISAILGHARKQGYVDSLPVAPKRQEPEKRVRWATQKQATKLVAALPAHLAPMVEFSLATGLRRHNVTHLEWGAVDLRRRVAWIHADQAKGARTISIPLNEGAIAVLRAQQGRHPRYVFPYQGRAMVRQGAHAWGAACAAAGLKGFRWHDLRHTWASWHIQNGTTLAALQELGGWRSLAMVMRYAHLGPSHLAAAAENSGLVRNRAQREEGGRGDKAA